MAKTLPRVARSMQPSPGDISVDSKTIVQGLAAADGGRIACTDSRWGSQSRSLCTQNNYSPPSNATTFQITPCSRHRFFQFFCLAPSPSSPFPALAPYASSPPTVCILREIGCRFSSATFQIAPGLSIFLPRALPLLSFPSSSFL